MKVKGAKMEAYTYNPSAWKVEKGGAEASGQSWTHHEFNTSLVCGSKQTNK